jgi:hypothetical protein
VQPLQSFDADVIANAIRQQSSSAAHRLARSVARARAEVAAGG